MPPHAPGPDSSDITQYQSSDMNNGMDTGNGAKGRHECDSKNTQLRWPKNYNPTPVTSRTSVQPDTTNSHSSNDNDRTEYDVAEEQAFPMLDPHSKVGENGTDADEERCSRRQTEWIPVMLRPMSAVLLIAYCLGLILGLELLNDLPKTRHGIPTTDTNARRAAKYVPVVLVLLFDVFWKRLVVDLKRIVPWACLSRGWTLGRDSLELNYLDDLEFTLIWPSARRRHWALFLGLFGGLFSGALVSLAAALTFVDLAGKSVHPILVRHDAFDFTDTLSTSNSSLNLLKSSLGSTPWASAANVLQSVGSSPAWTSDSTVFVPFHASGTHLDNYTVTANTTAITAKLSCEVLQVNTTINVADAYTNDAFDIQISAHTQININLTSVDGNRILAQQAVIKEPDSVNDPPIAWLNQSSPTDASAGPNTMPILLTLLQPIVDSGHRLYWNGSFADGGFYQVPVRTYRGIGLSCTPTFYSASARVSVNASNNIITSYALDNGTSSPININLSSDYIIGYLNNPLHPDTIFGISGTRNEIQLQDVIQLGGGGNYLPDFYTAFSGSDPFGTQLLDANSTAVDNYFENPSLLEADVSRVFATIMTQVIRAFAVTSGTETSMGQTEVVVPLLKVQQPILRVLEGCIVTLIIIAFCCTWPLRPRTCLVEDPGSLHFIANLVARNEALDAILKIDGKATTNGWRDSYFRLRQDSGVMHIEVAPGFRGPAAAPDSKPAYEPLSLRLAARWGLLLLLNLCIVALGVLYGCGEDRGYPANTRASQIAWAFVPTAVLVLTGYAVSGATSAVQAIAPLAMLKTEHLSGRRVMKFSPRNRSELTLPYHSLFKKGWTPVMLTAGIVLAYPVVKILAADLYPAFESSHLRARTFETSPAVFDFAQLAQTDGGTESRLRNTAAIRTDWVQLPELGVQSQPNVVRNLVFQNATVSGGDEIGDGRLATVELTALAVNMRCDSFSNDKFNVSAWNSPSLGLTFGFACVTDDCKNKIPSTQLDDDDNQWIAIRPANWDYYRTDPYTTLNRRFWGLAGTFFSSPTVQVFIGDFESLSGPVSNSSYIPDDSAIPVSADMFNVSMPTMRAVSCTPLLQNVRVNATMEKRVQADLDGQSTVLPWAVADFDSSSLKVISDLNESDSQVWRKLFPKGSYWGHSPFLNRDFSSVTSNWTNESDLGDDDIRPASGIASNFFDLLASYERSQGRNATAVLDVDELASATIAVYGLYNAELLSHFRASTPLPSTDARREVQAQLQTTQVRVRPNTGTTFAVIGLLLLILLLLLAVFLTTASENILLDKPGMVSTQLSLFAGSRVAQLLRGENPDQVWDQRFSLGWWRTEDPEKDDGEGVRWGIDIGKLDATLQGYNSEKKKKKRRKPFSLPSFFATRKYRRGVAAQASLI